jgi:hypothetical protein
MFAKGSSSDDYHLLKDEEHTLCGRAVAPIIIDRPVKTSHLHLTTTAPKDRRLCKDCAASSSSVMAAR